MRLSRETKEYHRMLVREAMIKIPSASGMALQESILIESKVRLGIKYIFQLRDKIQRRKNYEIGEDLTKLIIEKRDRLDVATKTLWGIVKTPSGTKDAAQARVSALRELREWHKEYLAALFDSGHFERELGRIKNTELLVFAELVDLGNSIRDEFNKKDAIEGPTKDIDKGSG